MKLVLTLQVVIVLRAVHDAASVFSTYCGVGKRCARFLPHIFSHPVEQDAYYYLNRLLDVSRGASLEFLQRSRVLTYWVNNFEMERAANHDHDIEAERGQSNSFVYGYRNTAGVVFCIQKHGSAHSVCCRATCLRRRLESDWEQCCFQEERVSIVDDKSCLPAKSVLRVWDKIANWRIYSQSMQDSVLAFLFSHIGVTNRHFVEIGFNQPSWESIGSGPNTQLLSESGWHGLLLDDTYENSSIRLFRHSVTYGNVAELLQRYKVPMEPDYLSIDIDGCDLWVFLGVTRSFRPRVVSLEYNSNWKVQEVTTVDCFFKEGFKHGKGWHPEAGFMDDTHDNIFGASLTAIDRAARLRNYSVVHVLPQYDVFLVRNDLICPDNDINVSSFAKHTGLRMHLPGQPGRADFCLINFDDVALDRSL